MTASKTYLIAWKPQARLRETILQVGLPGLLGWEPSWTLGPVEGSLLRYVPIVWGYVPTVWGYVPTAWSHVPTVWSHVPTVWSHVPTAWSHVPTVWSHVPTVWSHVPTVWSHVPTVWSYIDPASMGLLTGPCCGRRFGRPTHHLSPCGSFQGPLI